MESHLRPFRTPATVVSHPTSRRVSIEGCVELMATRYQWADTTRVNAHDYLSATGALPSSSAVPKDKDSATEASRLRNMRLSDQASTVADASADRHHIWNLLLDTGGNDLHSTRGGIL